MPNRALTLIAVLLLAAPATAQTYTSPGAFSGAAGTPSYTETFESVPIPKDAAFAAFTQAGITYIGQAGTNVWVASPGYNNFGAGLNPTTTSILTANGDENFLIQFLTPYSAVGFDVYYNGLGPASSRCSGSVVGCHGGASSECSCSGCNIMKKAVARHSLRSLSRILGICGFREVAIGSIHRLIGKRGGRLAPPPETPCERSLALCATTSEKEKSGKAGCQQR